jgi:hypothetical protein
MGAFITFVMRSEPVLLNILKSPLKRFSKKSNTGNP